MTMHARRSAFAVSAAAALSLVIAGQALGHTWSARKTLSSSGEAKSAGVVGLTSSDAVAAYLDFNGASFDVDVTRSTTSGASWGTPKTLSTNAIDASIAGLSPYVDVVWATKAGTFRYARSVNGGKSFSAAVTLSYSGGSPTYPHVARGPGGLVAVAWQEKNLDTVFARVSTDGGVTFGNSRTFASSGGSGTTIAVGNGIVYLGYETSNGWTNVVNTTDGGVTWSSSQLMTSSTFGAGEYGVVASGNDAYFVFADYNPSYPQWGLIRYRHTTNAGLTWGNTRQISASSWKTGYPTIEMSGGVERIAYFRKTSTGYSTYYQQSSDGLNWSNAELVDTGSEDPFGVADAGKIIVQFRTGSGPVGNVYVRTAP